MTTLNRTIPKSLPPISGLTFDEAAHRYHLEGHGWITVSTTSVLSAGDSQDKKDRIAQTKHIWEPRGNTVHACLEAHLLGAAQLNPGDYADWVDPLLAHPLFTKYRAIAVEHRLYGLWSRLTYAGSLDFLLTDGERLLLGDLKTLSSARGKTRDISGQLGAYCIAIEQHYGLFVDACIGVFSKPGSVDVTTYTPDQCTESWTRAVERYEMQQLPF